MTIRPAEDADVPRLVEMGCRFIAETGYRGLVVANPARMEETARALLTSPDALLIVAQNGTPEPVGMLGAFVFVHPMSGERVASELFWWVEPEHRGGGLKLLRHFERWAEAQNVDALQMTAPTPEVAQLYERLTYQRVETAYQRRR